MVCVVSANQLGFLHKLYLYYTTIFLMGATQFHLLSFINLNFVIKTADYGMGIVLLKSKTIKTNDLNIDKGYK